MVVGVRCVSPCVVCCLRFDVFVYVLFVMCSFAVARRCLVLMCVDRVMIVC